MNKNAPKVTYLKDYQKPDYLIPKIELSVDLFESHTTVISKIRVVKNHDDTAPRPLVLNGEQQTLLSVSLDGKPLTAQEYSLDDTSLTIPMDKDEADIEIETEIKPQENLALEGLYKSGNIFCTQNEPEGFRRITYFIDRPDIMSRYTTRISANKLHYPYLLSNGNLIGGGDLEGGRHYALWEDPFPKPCYLFALVAGDFDLLQDTFVTKSGRTVVLEIYSDRGNKLRCCHAMDSLKKAMAWDQDVFGLEYDLNRYMIVAVHAFNMGAMENKGLNIFNASYVLANPETATDADYQNIERVIAHEYFHNWTGNRVTCRDWFQLTLKEGLTVFRDQEFSADMNSRPVQRINDVRQLREMQFSEDASPMAHPIKPASYVEINNFYTVTVYEKGAEVIRMIRTLIGPEKFRKGMDTYFRLFDGQAVTTEDFVRAMEEASGKDLTQFKNWYHQAGTPLCTVSAKYDEVHREYHLTIRQECPPTSESLQKKPFYFPFVTGLLSRSGQPLTAALKNDENEINGERKSSHMLTVSREKETFTFTHVTEEPLPSLLRGFSAPVKVDYPYELDDLVLIIRRDTDPFNRYDAVQTLAKYYLHRLIDAIRKNQPVDSIIDKHLLLSFGYLLDDKNLDPALIAEMFTLPSVNMLAEETNHFEVDAAFEAREHVITAIAATHAKRLLEIYNALATPRDYTIDAAAMGNRRLKSMCLSYLGVLGCDYIDLAFYQFEHANNMTDEIGALSVLANMKNDPPEKEAAIRMFYEKWHKEVLVMDKWLAIQASAKYTDALKTVTELEKAPVFNPTNPNRIRALYGSFSRNLPRFHDKSGDGYRFMAEKIAEVDRFNPDIAARLALAFKHYPKCDKLRKGLMKKELDDLLKSDTLSKNVYEVLSKTLKGK